MKTDYLYAFQALEKHLSFTNAANSLYISQSSFSKRINMLEDELSGQLFIRRANSKVALSPYGEFMSSYIHNAIASHEMLYAAADEYKLNRSRKLHIAAFLNFSFSDILVPITKCEKNEPNFYVETDEVSHIKIQTLMESHQVDMCFAYRELLRDVSGYTAYLLWEDPLVLVTWREHAKAMGWSGSVSLSDLSREKLYFLREDMDLFNFLMSACHSSGFAPKLTYSNVRISAIAQYMREGMRSTLNTETVARSVFSEDEFVVLPIQRSPKLHLTMYVDNTRERKVKQKLAEEVLSYYRAVVSRSHSAFE